MGDSTMKVFATLGLIRCANSDAHLRCVVQAAPHMRTDVHLHRGRPPLLALPLAQQLGGEIAFSGNSRYGQDKGRRNMASSSIASRPTRMSFTVVFEQALANP